MNDMFGDPVPTHEEESYCRKVTDSILNSVRSAKRRQNEKGNPVSVNLTRQQVVALLEHQEYRCALTRQRFWVDASDRFGPSMPSLDRVKHDGPYAIENVRVVLIGVNSLRGRGSDEDMYRNARALIANEPANETRD